MIRETILPNGNKLVEDISERVTIFNVHTSSGEFVSAGFQCRIDPDNPAYLAALYDEDYRENYERDEFLKKHDPNRIDGRRVRRELKDNFVNLGRRVNRIPSTVKRI